MRPLASAAAACARSVATAASNSAGLDNRLDVVKALTRIAPFHREVLVLYYFDDMPTLQMAEALEIAPGTVLSRLARAREALKTAMLPPAKPEATGKPRVPAMLTPSVTQLRRT